MSWHRTSIQLSDMKDKEIRSSQVSNQKVVFVREGDHVYALEDRCSHDNSEFDGGQIIDGNIECPRHGAWFDYKTGQVTGMPAVVGIKSFPTKIQEGVICVEV